MMLVAVILTAVTTAVVVRKAQAADPVVPAKTVECKEESSVWVIAKKFARGEARQALWTLIEEEGCRERFVDVTALEYFHRERSVTGFLYLYREPGERPALYFLSITPPFGEES